MSSGLGKRIAMGFGRAKAGLVALASLVGLAGALAAPTPAAGAVVVNENGAIDPHAKPSREPKRRKGNRFSKAIKKLRRGWSRWTPHQGARECARRRGGIDWRLERDFDRERRGLPAIHFSQHGA